MDSTSLHPAWFAFEPGVRPSNIHIHDSLEALAGHLNATGNMLVSSLDISGESIQNLGAMLAHMSTELNALIDYIAPTEAEAQAEAQRLTNLAKDEGRS